MSPSLRFCLLDNASGFLYCSVEVAETAKPIDVQASILDHCRGLVRRHGLGESDLLMYMTKGVEVEPYQGFYRRVCSSILPLRPVDQSEAFYEGLKDVMFQDEGLVHLVIVTRERYPSHGTETSADPDAILPLSEGDTAPECQAAFCLYKNLWRQRSNLTRLIKTAKEIIPPLELDTSFVISQVKRVDLTSLKGWPSRTQQLVSASYLLRREYEVLDKYIDDMDTSQNADGHHVTLTGQPGIGKSVYLTHCLLNRLADGKPTFYAITEEHRILFLESGVYLAPYRAFNRHVEDLAQFDEKDDARVLFDLNALQSKIMNTRAWRTLISTSPKPEKYKEWDKQTDSTTYIMKTWTWAEIYAFRETAKESCRCLDQWRAAYLKYGGSARHLLAKHESFIEATLKKAIRDSDVLSLVRPFGHQFKTSTSHYLVQINPVVKDDGSIDRGVAASHIISIYIFRLLNSSQRQIIASELQNSFWMLLNRSETRSAAGILFEATGHDCVFNMCKTSLRLRPLGMTQNQNVLNLLHVDSLDFFEHMGQPFELLPENYYLPLSSRLPGIDSFALEVDDTGAISGIVMFQFTVRMKSNKGWFFEHTTVFIYS